jgi:hypothetical protein
MPPSTPSITPDIHVILLARRWSMRNTAGSRFFAHRRQANARGNEEGSGRGTFDRGDWKEAADRAR